MNWDQFKKKGLGMRVELEPAACFLDEHGRPLAVANRDWLVQSFPDSDVVVLQNETIPIIAKLGKDHVYDFRSNPIRSRGEIKYGFLVLKMQVCVQGSRLWLRPNRAPGEPARCAPTDAAALPKPFPQAGPTESPGKFRPVGKPIGDRWELYPPKNGQSVFLQAGAVAWFRLVPTSPIPRRWASIELRERASNPHLIPLTCPHSLYWLRAEDGVGICHLSGPQATETPSAAFLFETGEIWAVDTRLLGFEPSVIPAGPIEDAYRNCLDAYVGILANLGLQAPYMWECGLSGVEGRCLEVPLPRGQRRIPGWTGPDCKANTIEFHGTYDGKEAYGKVLLPFFDEIYFKCGIRRPDHLPRE